MKTLFHPSEDRGHFDFGWLNTYHSFSFGRFFDPAKMNFGALRVLNDDTVMPGSGFGEHPHDNMEIISIPLEGALGHRDSTGGEHSLRTNEVQVMSAGTGLTHSEYNHSKEEEVKLLQIWIIPEERDLKPRYEQDYFNRNERLGQWQLLVHPKARGGGLWINQDAWIHRAELVPGENLAYRIRSEGNGLYVFMIKGQVRIGEQVLNERDALGLSHTDEVTVETITAADILAIEIPMIRL